MTVPQKELINFGPRTIQVKGRIALQETIMEKHGIAEGDIVEVYLRKVE
jgi:bifunctional DNA-binding transcriptional regulator/antitoxin component of YhaV-PrlF toxin-antitoxin module